MSEPKRKILFATSNGTGLGHLNRSMAIARRLPDEIEPVFFTLSQAAPVVAASGFRVEYFPSYRRPASGSDWQWNLRLRRRLEVLLEDEHPDLVVFDGVHPYRALTHVLSARDAPASVWCRRPLWRRGSSKAPLRRTGAFDAVLEPGELAADLDRGPTAERRDEVIAVDPIVFCDEDELLARDEAAEELGLDPERTTALVNLGQGGATGAAVARVLRALTADADLQVAALRSSIGPGLARAGRGDAARRHLPDEPLLPGLRSRGRGGWIQRLPRADRLLAADPVRADAAQHRRSGGAGPLGGRRRGCPGDRGARRRAARGGARGADRSAGRGRRSGPPASPRTSETARSPRRAPSPGSRPARSRSRRSAARAP